MEQTDAAIQAWEKAIDLQPSFASAHLNLGNAYFEMGSFQIAESEWEEAFVGKPVDIPTHLVNLGMVHLRSEEYNKAVMAWKRASELKPDDFNLHYNLALAFYNQGRYDSVNLELKECLRLQPNSQNVHMLLERIEQLGGEKID